MYCHVICTLKTHLFHVVAAHAITSGLNTLLHTHTHTHTHIYLVVSGDESGEEEGGGDKVGASLKVQQTQLEAEKQAILQNKELLEEVHYIQ